MPFVNLGIGIGITIGTDIANVIISSSTRPIEPKLELGREDPTHKVTRLFNIVVTWQIKYVISPPSQGLRTPNFAGW